MYVRTLEIIVFNTRLPPSPSHFPAQVAALVAMLCGDEAKQITGSALVIDGGGLAQ